MTGLCKLITRFARDERATATMEFVIMFPVVITLFIAVFENGVILTRQVLLERSLDEAVRLLRLARTITDAETGQPRALTAADISEAICDNTGAIPDCDTVLVVDLRVIDTTTYALPAADVSCVDRRDLTIQPANEFRQGQNNDLVVMQRDVPGTFTRDGYIGIFYFENLVVGSDGSVSLQLTERYANPR